MGKSQLDVSVFESEFAGVEWQRQPSTLGLEEAFFQRPVFQKASELLVRSEPFQRTQLAAGEEAVGNPQDITRSIGAFGIDADLVIHNADSTDYEARGVG